MFLPNPIACDVCKTIKQPSNHWFYSITNRGNAFALWPWDDFADNPSPEDRHAVIHLCGQACAVKKLAEWMNQQKQEPDKLDTHDNAQG